MVTFKPVVFHQSRPKDGAYNVKIRVTYKGVSRFLPTTLYCTQSDLTRQGKIRQGNVLTKGIALCDEMRSTLSDVSPFTLEEKDVDWVINHIKTSLSSGKFRLDFFEFAEEVIRDKPYSTKQTYIIALRSFSEFTGGRIDINDITANLLKEFIDWVRKSPIRHNGVIVPNTMHRQGSGERKVAKLQYIYNAAQSKYNDEDADRILIPKHPFDRVDLKLPPSEGQRPLGADFIQMLIDADTKSKNERYAIDYLLISFLLMGVNAVDLFEAKPPKNGVWEYNRAKTRDNRADRAYMRIYVPDEIKPYIERHLDPTGRHWLDISRYKTIGNARKYIGFGLNAYADRVGIPHFSYYAARKTWGTLARKLGVEKATVDECLAHVGDYRIADIYIERDWDIINAANRRVISQFRW